MASGIRIYEVTESSSSALPRQMTILVVENHADTLKYIRMYLELSGHLVLSATTMRDALAVLVESEVDVLISDIGLPDGDGWTLLRRARPIRPVYSIAMSGYYMTVDRRRSEAVGFRQHVQKPFLPEDLDRMIEEAARERGFQ